MDPIMTACATVRRPRAQGIRQPGAQAAKVLKGSGSPGAEWPIRPGAVTALLQSKITLAWRPLHQSARGALLIHHGDGDSVVTLLGKAVLQLDKSLRERDPPIAFSMPEGSTMAARIKGATCEPAPQ